MGPEYLNNPVAPQSEFSSEKLLSGAKRAEVCAGMGTPVRVQIKKERDVESDEEGAVRHDDCGDEPTEESRVKKQLFVSARVGQGSGERTPGAPRGPQRLQG